MEIVKFIAAALFGSGVSYGIMRAEIKSIKEKIAEGRMYGERLAAIEAKIDFLINQQKN